MPFFEDDSITLEKFIHKHTTAAGMWSNFDTYFISLLKSWYGDAATEANEWGFQWLPRVTGDHSELGYWLDMADGKMEGLFVMGQNPAVGAPNGRLQRKAMKNLKWLVVRDLRRGRNGKLLEGLARGAAGRTESGGDRHRSISHARGWAGRKKWQLHEYAAPRPVA
jgi:hypothetical protein